MCTPTRAALLTGRYQQRFGPPVRACPERSDGPRPGASAGGGDDRGGAEGRRATRPASTANGTSDTRHPTCRRARGSTSFVGFCQVTATTTPTSIGPGTPTGGTARRRHSSAFIERHRDEPFFLFVSHLAIHFPWQGPDDPPHRVAGRDYWNDKWGMIPDEDNVAPHVKAMVEALDESVGDIVATLRRLDLGATNARLLHLGQRGLPALRPPFSQHLQQRSLTGTEDRRLRGRSSGAGHRALAGSYTTRRLRPHGHDLRSVSDVAESGRTGHWTGPRRGRHLGPAVRRSRARAANALLAHAPASSRVAGAVEARVRGRQRSPGNRKTMSAGRTPAREEG